MTMLRSVGRGAGSTAAVAPAGDVARGAAVAVGVPSFGRRYVTPRTAMTAVLKVIVAATRHGFRRFADVGAGTAPLPPSWPAIPETPIELRT